LDQAKESRNFIQKTIEKPPRIHTFRTKRFFVLPGLYSINTPGMKLDGKAIQAAMMQLVEDYKFDPYQILEISKLGIKSGFKKDYPEFKKSDILVDIKEDGTVKIYKAMEVVEEVEDPDTQIPLKDAKTVRKDTKI